MRRPQKRGRIDQHYQNERFDEDVVQQQQQLLLIRNNHEYNHHQQQQQHEKQKHLLMPAHHHNQPQNSFFPNNNNFNNNSNIKQSQNNNYKNNKKNNNYSLNKAYSYQNYRHQQQNQNRRNSLNNNNNNNNDNDNVNHIQRGQRLNINNNISTNNIEVHSNNNHNYRQHRSLSISSSLASTSSNLSSPSSSLLQIFNSSNLISNHYHKLPKIDKNPLSSSSSTTSCSSSSEIGSSSESNPSSGSSSPTLLPPTTICSNSDGSLIDVDKLFQSTACLSISQQQLANDFQFRSTSYTKQQSASYSKTINPLSPTSAIYQQPAFWFPKIIIDNNIREQEQQKVYNQEKSSINLTAPPPRPWILNDQQKVLNSKTISKLNKIIGDDNENSEYDHDDGPEFTVLSYNVLCDRMVNNEMFPSSPEIALNWIYRRELITKQLLEFNPDIIALQELELEQFEIFFKPELNRLANYDSIFEPKSRARTMDSQKRKRVDGCAIFFKSNKFKLIQRHLLEYNQIAMANAQGSEAMLNRVMTKDNIGLAAILEFIEPIQDEKKQQKQQQNEQARRILVCNTHIHWDPECCDVKLIQTIMLMNELECIAKNYKLIEQFEFQKVASNSTSIIGPQARDSNKLKYEEELNSLASRATTSNLTFTYKPSASKDCGKTKTTVVNDVDGDKFRERKNDDYIVPIDYNNNNSCHEDNVNDLLPLVLLGDFNSLPDSGVLGYLTSGNIDSLHRDFKNYKYTPCSNALSCFFSRTMSSNLAISQSTSSNIPALDDTALLMNSSSSSTSNKTVFNSKNINHNSDNLQLRRQSSPAWCFYSSTTNPLLSTTPAHNNNNNTISSSLYLKDKNELLHKQEKSIKSEISNGKNVNNLVFNYNHPFKLINAYEDQTLMPYTNYTIKFKAIIDYIFYSQDSIRLLGLLGPLDKNWLNSNHIIGFPQPHLPSDHLPLLVKLKLISKSIKNEKTKNELLLSKKETKLEIETETTSKHEKNGKEGQINCNKNDCFLPILRKKAKQEKISPDLVINLLEEKTSPKLPNTINCSSNDNKFQQKTVMDYSRICQNLGKQTERVNFKRNLNLINNLSNKSSS